MNGNPQTDAAPPKARNRRSTPRKPVDEPAELRLLHPSCVLACRILDLGLGGCRVRTEDRFLAGIMTRLEVVFTVKGVNFRLTGVTQWTDRRNLVGIRFLEMTERRKDALAEALSEVIAEPLP
ncbi:MAG TPA: PilZ domain-containing protein [Terracidiphilus sp.]|nr:PilZ domain-containing protein [Terracidiphilus sp.]